MAEGFDSVAIVLLLDQSIAEVCEDQDVAQAWIDRQNEPWLYYIIVHPVERRRNRRSEK